MSQNFKNSDQIYIKEISDLSLGNENKRTKPRIIVVHEKRENDEANEKDNEDDDENNNTNHTKIYLNGAASSRKNKLKPQTSLKKKRENTQNVLKNSLPQNDEANLNGIHLLSVTSDFSKDYSSSSDESNKDGKSSGMSKAESICDDHLMIAPLNLNEATDEKEKNNEVVNCDMSIYSLIDRNSKKFILKPASMGLYIRAQIFRQKSLYPKYKFYLENLDGKLMLLMTARKRKKTKTTCYIINSITYSSGDDEKYIETPMAKLKSNLLGTLFTLYDFGVKPSRQLTIPTATATNTTSEQSDQPSNQIEINHHDNNNNEENKLFRKEFLSVSYELNLFGFKGPRAMCIIIPGMDNDFNREDFYLKNENDSILDAWKKLEAKLKLEAKEIKKENASSANASQSSPSKTNLNPTSLDNDEVVDNYNSKVGEDLNNLSDQANVVKLINKTPAWHPQLKSFALNFNGRVTQASVKNYQIVHEVNLEYIVTQFGKVDNDLYTCDYSYPLCALQAFGIALTSLHNKLGCD